MNKAERAVGRFKAWLRAARQGEKFAYHSGLLMLDRVPPMFPVGVGDEERDAFWEATQITDCLAHAAARAEGRGLVVLVQFRLPSGGCLYLAQRTGKVVPNGY
jgi:hypothetical protein